MALDGQPLVGGHVETGALKDERLRHIVLGHRGKEVAVSRPTGDLLRVDLGLVAVAAEGSQLGEGARVEDPITDLKPALAPSQLGTVW